MDNNTKSILSSLTVEDVLQVYSGKQGCMCGCNGKYFVNPSHREEADKEHGYAHEDADMSPRMVKKVLKLLQEGSFVNYDENMAWVANRPSAERNYTMYLTKAGIAKVKEKGGLEAKFTQ